MSRFGMICPGRYASSTVSLELQYKHAGYHAQALELIATTMLGAASSLGAFYSNTISGQMHDGMDAHELRELLDLGAKKTLDALRRTGEYVVTGKYGNMAMYYDRAECSLRMRAKLLPHKSHLDVAGARAATFSHAAEVVMAETMFPVEKWVLETRTAFVPIEAEGQEDGDPR